MNYLTGEKCPRSGIYKADCLCVARIALSKSETFPPCRACKRRIKWTLVQPTQWTNNATTVETPCMSVSTVAVYPSTTEQISMKKKIHTGSFLALDAEGNKFVLQTFVEKISAASLTNERATIDGLKSIKTATGEPVNYIEKGKYKLVVSEKIVYSTDQNCP